MFDEALAKGAESDSDAPPDERAPAFFVNEDGTKALATLHAADRLVVSEACQVVAVGAGLPMSSMQVPRPRTRKERMGLELRASKRS